MVKFIFPIISIVFFISMLSFGSLTASYNNITDQATEAIRRGSSSDLAKHFGNNIDLVIPGSDGTYSKSHAKHILRNFFSDNRPESFTVNHQGSSRDGSLYVIGTFETTDNKSYRTYFLVKKVSGNFFIHQLQFELQ